MDEREQEMRLRVWRFPSTGPAEEGFVGMWFVSDEALEKVYSVHPTHAEAFADAWARTHPKASLVPLGNDTYRVVGAMRRSAVTGRYLTSADKGE